MRQNWKIEKTGPVMVSMGDTVTFKHKYKAHPSAYTVGGVLVANHGHWHTPKPTGNGGQIELSTLFAGDETNIQINNTGPVYATVADLAGSEKKIGVDIPLSPGNVYTNLVTHNPYVIDINMNRIHLKTMKNFGKFSTLHGFGEGDTCFGVFDNLNEYFAAGHKIPV